MSTVRSIVILGAGELGGALARQIAAADIVARVVLVDDACAVAEGKALDIRQAAPVDGYSTDVAGTRDESAVVGADAIVIADRVQSSSEWQEDAGVALVRRVSYLNPSAPVFCAGARQLTIVERSVREGGLSPRRVIGSAPEALRSAVIAMTALEARCAPDEVSLTVLGRPPEETIVPWEDASIGGRRASEVLSAPAITRLDARLPRLWPPGPLTLACATTRFLRTATLRSAHTLSAFVAAGVENGRPAHVGMLPVTMTERGVETLVWPTLSTRDRVRLDTALQR
jgi:malate/lactate dehydrogenase